MRSLHPRLHQCNPGIGLKAFFDMIHELPKKTFILGDTCSAVTDIIAKAARHWNLIQVKTDVVAVGSGDMKASLSSALLCRYASHVH